MEGKKQKLVPLACRFLPYDQWFVTHVDPTWKIKHLKQIILAKCLSLPFDPRQLPRGGGDTSQSTPRRPPSPITFAPDESQRPVSPIEFATPKEVSRKRSRGHGLGLGLVGGGDRDRDSEGEGEGSGEGRAFGEEGGREGVGGEEGYDEDDEWDEEEDEEEEDGVPGGRLVGLRGQASSVVVVGGRVQVSGGVSAWAVAGSPPASSALTSASTSATPASPPKTRKKFNPLAKIATSSFTNNPTPTPSSSAPPTDGPSTTLVPHRQAQQHTQEKEIYTSFHTLIRFSTSQILEEDIPISWYDLLPYELVELHASVPPLSFAMSVGITQHLLNPGEMLEAIREKDREFVDKLKAMSKMKGKATANANANADGDGSVLRQPVSSALMLVALPRHDPEAYAQPYWEGWVRALRMVSRAEIDPTPAYHSHTHQHHTAKSPPGGSSSSTNPTNPANVTSPAGTSRSQPSGGGGGGSYPYYMQEYAMGMTNFSGSMGGGLIGAWAGVGDGEASVGLFRDVNGRDVVPPSRYPLGRGRGVGGGGGGAGAGGGGAGGGRENGRRERVANSTVTYEWRERYMVIRDGVVNLFKSRDDQTAAHRLPLSTLMDLRDVEDMGPVLKAKMSRSTTSLDSGTSGTATITAVTPTNATASRQRRSSRGASATPRATSHRERERGQRRSSSLPRSGTSTAKDLRRGGPDDAPAGAATLPSSHRVASSSRGRTDADEPGTAHKHDYLRPGPPPSTAVSRPLTEAEREVRRAAAEKRQREREERERKRRQLEKHEKEIEYLRKWDDISIPLWPKRDREKERDRDKGKGREKGRDRVGERDRKERQSLRGRDRERRSEREGETSNKGKEREKDETRTRFDSQHHSQHPHHPRDHDHEQHQHDRQRRRQRHQEKAKLDERTYIPSTREEAEAAGMKIVCAKFRQARPGERASDEPLAGTSSFSVNTYQDANSNSGVPVRKYTRTGPSLAGEPNNVQFGGDVDGEPQDGGTTASGRAKDARHVFSDDQASSAVAGPPRRPSLPALVGLRGASASSMNSAINPTSSLPATSNLSLHALHTNTNTTTSGTVGSSGGAAFNSSSSAAASPIVGGPPKFIGGLFGKDKSVEERERKAREKEQKALEKEMRKLRKRDRDRDKEKEKDREREREKDTGDEDEGATSSGLGWKLRWNTAGSSTSVGKLRERESLDAIGSSAVAVAHTPPSTLSAQPSTSTLRTDEESAKKALSPSYRSVTSAETDTTLTEAREPESRRSASLASHGDEARPTGAPTRPRLTLSPTTDPPATGAESRPPPDNQDDPLQQLLPDLPLNVDEEEDQDSDSRSLSSPVFAHSDDEIEDDFDDELGFGVSGYRRDRMGYRYGGYQRKAEVEKEMRAKAVGVGAPAAPGPSLLGSVGLGFGNDAVEGGHSRQRPATAPDEVGVVSPHWGMEAGNGSANDPAARQLHTARSTTTFSSQQRREPRRRRDEERGEWVVLDLGNEHAYNSILRVLHRYYSHPLNTAFVKSSFPALQPPPSSNLASTSIAAHAETNVGSSDNPSTSNLNSPTQANFWSSTTLVDGPDASSIMGNVTESLRTDDSLSSMPASSPPPPSLRQPSQKATPGSDADDEDAQAHSALRQEESHSVSAPQTRPEHPPVLNALVAATKPNKWSALTPALHYPEWRMEVVFRAKRHGMREAGRPLDLRLHGWSVEFDEAALRAKLEQRREEDERRAREELDEEQRSGSEEGGEEKGDKEGGAGDEIDVEGGSADEEGSEEDEAGPRGFVDEQRRMSAISHVSTLNALQMNAAAAAAVANRPPVSRDQVQPSEREAQDKSSVISEEGDSGYVFKYGHEDEEEAIALGMDSLLEDSDEETEESEMEWVAWMTDLPRQISVRQARKQEEAEQRKERRKLQGLQLVLPDANQLGRRDAAEQPQLSPMLFSDPFEQDQELEQAVAEGSDSAPVVVRVNRRRTESKVSIVSTSSGHAPVWQSQEEERRQVVESRRMLEPTATSTFVPPSQSQLLSPEPEAPIHVYGQRPSSSSGSVHNAGGLSYAHTLYQGSSLTRTPAQVLVQSEMRVRTQSQTLPVPLYTLQRQPSQTRSMSTMSSLESLRNSNPGRSVGGAASSVPPIDIGFTSVEPRSPQQSSFSPESDLTDGYRDMPSSSTTPPSSTGHYQSKLVLAKTHSRTLSASDPSRMSRLYHSSSMPLATAAAATAGSSPGLAVTAVPVPSLPPKSPMRSVSSTSTAVSGPTSTPPGVTTSSAGTYPVNRPILTPEQIHQIEAETEMEMRQRHNQSSPSRLPISASPPSSYTPRMPIPIPRRSSSAGASSQPGFTPSSAPSGSAPGLPSESGSIGLVDTNSSGGVGSIGRSASVLKTYSTNAEGSGAGSESKSGHRVLRKRASDIARQISGDEKESSPSTKGRKPNLSLARLDDNSTSLSTYQHPRQGLRSPTVSSPSSAQHTFGSGDLNTSGGGSSNTGTMSSAKAFLRRVRSGSSLRMDMHPEERESPAGSSYPAPNSPVATYTSDNVNTNTGRSWGRNSSISASSERAKPRKGPMDRLVRGIDSALEFKEGG